MPRFVPTQNWLNEKFKEFNRMFFKNTLKDINLSLNPNLKNKDGVVLYGKFSFGATWLDNEKKHYNVKPGSSLIQINNNASIGRSDKDWENTLLHEMIHAYVMTVRKIYYFKDGEHCGEFLTIAKAINSHGYNITINGDEENASKTSNNTQTETQPNVANQQNFLRTRRSSTAIIIVCDLSQFGGYVNPNISRQKAILICDSEGEAKDYEELFEEYSQKMTDGDFIYPKFFYIDNPNMAQLFIEYKDQNTPLDAQMAGETYGFVTSSENVVNDFYNELNKFVMARYNKPLNQEAFLKIFNE